ncbi:MAG TPA: cob(I)yrinic acid a,c-diamide adenosyltransferase [Spongiibacteraceae bacterium]|nr:cob(I)yrinic acid a,c-diamide adenosyltransferase [Spongiibacteraceae bacterium]
MSNDKDASDTHQKMVEKRNAGYEKKQAQATVEKGLVIVITGTGKGKTTSALGMGLRAVGHGMRLGVVQFIKGAKPTAERTLFETFPNVDWFTIGDGFTWITQDRERDIATAQKAWAQAAALIGDANYDMVILDELNTILKYEYVDVNVVLEALANKPAMQHVIITGRHAPEVLIEAADLVSDIRPLKHPYKEQGVKAQRGIEF